MNEYDFVLDMTSEQVERAERAGRLATDHAKGVKLMEGLDIGDSLLVGREIAMRLAGVNAPNGRAYADHFLRWKIRFGFPTDKTFNGFCDAAIYCAQHRDTANAIIASLPPKQRAELGIQGLFKRVRVSVREAGGEPRKPVPRLSPLAAMKQRNKELECELEEVKEKLAASEDGLFDPAKLKPEQLVRMLLENTNAAYCRKVVTILTQRLEEAAEKTKARDLAARKKGVKKETDRTAAEQAWRGVPFDRLKPE